AAKQLGVTPSSIQRWEAGASIPSEVAERMRELAGASPEYLLGRLVAVLSNVIYGYTPQQIGTSVGPADRASIGRLIQRAMNEQPARYAGLEGEIQGLFASLPSFPYGLNEGKAIEFWRGYYSRRK